jgi:hypothetical protein
MFETVPVSFVLLLGGQFSIKSEIGVVWLSCNFSPKAPADFLNISMSKKGRWQFVSVFMVNWMLEYAPYIV